MKNKLKIIIKSKWLIIIGVGLLMMVILIIVNSFLIIKLNGPSVINIKLNDAYVELKAKSSYFNHDLTGKIMIEGKVNSKKVGTYIIKYRIKYLFMTKVVTRKVNIIDDIAPVITLEGDLKLKVCPNGQFIDPGYSAYDNYDGDLTKKVKVTISKAKVTYEIQDTSKNKTLLYRELQYIDDSAPVITLKGNINNTLIVGDKYIEDGYNVLDNCDNELYNQVKISGEVNTNKAGTYQLKYEVIDHSGNLGYVYRTITVKPKSSGWYTDIIMGPKYINGILIVNKKYAIPDNYNPGVDQTAYQALTTLQNGANNDGYSIPLVSGFRSYKTQTSIYNNYVTTYGQAATDTFSARPGHSEHQTGLAFDVGAIDDNYGNTAGGQWLAQNCYKYGFIIRYQKGKENITGYSYEPWHIRYVGKDVATDIFNRQITLEEYLGV